MKKKISLLKIISIAMIILGAFALAADLLDVVTIIDIIVGIGFYGMGIFHLTLFVWPVLYLLGWYRRLILIRI